MEIRDDAAAPSVGPEPGAADYCRHIEAYLCRKNDGHLIRIVGPAFDVVSRWDAQGVPLNVACAGIDRYFERYYKKGPRRRPVRVEFCEADVLDAFDGWRRAVGISGMRPAEAQAGESETDPEASRAGRRVTLASHIERAIARLTAARAGRVAPELDRALDSTARALDALVGAARSARGAARDALIDQLANLDRTLITAVESALDEPARASIERAAKEALAPFRERMPPEAFQRANRAALERGVRDHFNLPVVSFDGG
jgi:hypothetical protein